MVWRRSSCQTRIARGFEVEIRFGIGTGVIEADIIEKGPYGSFVKDEYRALA